MFSNSDILEMKDIFKIYFLISYIKENLFDLRSQQLYADCTNNSVESFAQVKIENHDLV